MVLFLNAIPATFLAYMLPQQQTVFGIEDTYVEFVPLHSDQASDPAWGQAVVGGFDFDTTVQMHDPLAVLVVAKRFQWQWEQGRFFFGKHGGDLLFGGAVDASISTAGFPPVQISLRFFQTLEAFSLERCVLGMSDGGLDFSFSIGIFDPARQGDYTVVGEHVTIQWIQSGIVDVGDEHAFAQVIEHDDTGTTTQSAKCFLVQLGPDARAGAESQQAYGLAAVPERQHEQSCTSIFARLRIADHRAGAIIDLGLF